MENTHKDVVQLEREYLAKQGIDCPMCGGESTIESVGQLVAVGPVAWQGVKCEVCCFTGVDTYELTAVEIDAEALEAYSHQTTRR